MSIETIDDARDTIQKAIDIAGPYSNNVVGSALRVVANKFSYDEANALIDEFDIMDIFGIEKVSNK